MTFCLFEGGAAGLPHLAQPPANPRGAAGSPQGLHLQEEHAESCVCCRPASPRGRRSPGPPAWRPLSLLGLLLSVLYALLEEVGGLVDLLGGLLSLLVACALILVISSRVAIALVVVLALALIALLLFVLSIVVLALAVLRQGLQLFLLTGGLPIIVVRVRERLGIVVLAPGALLALAGVTLSHDRVVHLLLLLPGLLLLLQLFLAHGRRVDLVVHDVLVFLLLLGLRLGLGLMTLLGLGRGEVQVVPGLARGLGMGFHILGLGARSAAQSSGLGLALSFGLALSLLPPLRKLQQRWVIACA